MAIQEKDTLVDELKELKKKIVLDDNMNADKQASLLSSVLHMIRLAEMTDAEFNSYYYPSY